MALITVSSLRGAPGATAAAAALASVFPGEAVLVEADPDGGVLAARWGLATRPGLTDMAAKSRRGLTAGDMRELGQAIGPVRVVVAPPGADAATAAVRTLAPVLAEAGRTWPEGDVIADCGRLRPDSAAAPVVAAADVALVVLRPVLEDVAAAAAASLAPNTRLLLVGDRPHRPAEVADALGVDVLGVLADDSRGAGSPLRPAGAYHRSVREAVSALQTLLAVRPLAEMAV
ncbi:MAG TPA: hypothetical protein VF855_10035 [Acidimicrobiales bacterium]